MRTIFLSVLLLFTASADAALYKWLDQNGEVVYSDEPPYEGAEPLNPPSITTTPPVKYKPKPVAKPKPEAVQKSAPTNTYTELRIDSPKDDEAIRDNVGNLTVTLVVTPALDVEAGDTISILIDGKVARTDLQATTASFENIDRGTHQLQANIVNADGTVIKSSASISFHMLRYSQLFKKPAPKPAP